MASGKCALGKDAKGGAEDTTADKAKAARVVAQRRMVGYPVLKWAVHTEVLKVESPCVRWSQPAIQPAFSEDGAGTPPAPGKRSGHTISRMRECVLLFGGSGDRALFADVWQLITPELAWRRPAVQGQGPGPRAYHSAATRSHSAR